MTLTILQKSLLWCTEAQYTVTVIVEELLNPYKVLLIVGYSI